MVATGTYPPRRRAPARTSAFAFSSTRRLSADRWLRTLTNGDMAVQNARCGRQSRSESAELTFRGRNDASRLSKITVCRQISRLAWLGVDNTLTIMFRCQGSAPAAGRRAVSGLPEGAGLSSLRLAHVYPTSGDIRDSPHVPAGSYSLTNTSRIELPLPLGWQMKGLRWYGWTATVESLAVHY